MKITFKKSGINKTLFTSAYFNSKPQIIMSDTKIKEPLGLISQQPRNQIGKWLSEGSGWMIESVDKHYLNIGVYSPMKGSSYVKLPPELSHHMKGLINIKNSDECFRWCHVQLINPDANKDPNKITKQDKIIAQQLKFPVIVKQYNKIEKQKSIRINVFGYTLFFLIKNQ